MNIQKNMRRRVAAMFLCIGITTFTLSRFALLIQPLLSVSYDWKAELAIVCGQLLFQFPFIYLKTNTEKIVYYENMLMVSLIGSVLLIPLIATNQFYKLNTWYNVAYFTAVVGCMFLEHYRRVTFLKLPSYLCWTWVLYRLIVLTIIL